MPDVLKIIENLRNSLWSKYGDVLARVYTQEEIHLTYYSSDILKKHDHNHIFIRGGKIEGDIGGNVTFYSEDAMHAAFIAGRRIGLQEGADNSKLGREELIDRLIGELSDLKGE